MNTEQEDLINEWIFHNKAINCLPAFRGPYAQMNSLCYFQNERRALEALDRYARIVDPLFEFIDKELLFISSRPSFGAGNTSEFGMQRCFGCSDGSILRVFLQRSQRTKGDIGVWVWDIGVVHMGGVYQELGGAKHPQGRSKVLILMM